MSQTMLYKAPGPHAIHGHMLDFIVVADEQIDAAIAEGWHLTTPEAVAAVDREKAEAEARAQAQAEQEAAAKLADDTAPPTRDELEQMAAKLGLPFNSRTSDKKLRQMIDAAAAPAETPATEG